MRSAKDVWYKVRKSTHNFTYYRIWQVTEFLRGKTFSVRDEKVIHAKTFA